MANEHILVVDDDPNIGKLLTTYLQNQGFTTSWLDSGLGLSQHLTQYAVDLILLDVMLPEEDGLSLARKLRTQNNKTGIIMISACAEEVDKIVGLEVGADDYISKPINFRELLARIRAVLRRCHTHNKTYAPEKTQHIYHFSGYQLDTLMHRLLKNNAEIALTSTEFNLLEVFVTHPHQVLNRDELAQWVRKSDHTPIDRSIDVRISRLRQKIEARSGNPSHIRTIRGEGYMFTP